MAATFYNSASTPEYAVMNTVYESWVEMPMRSLILRSAVGAPLLSLSIKPVDENQGFIAAFSDRVDAPKGVDANFQAYFLRDDCEFEIAVTNLSPFPLGVKARTKNGTGFPARRIINWDIIHPSKDPVMIKGIADDGSRFSFKKLKDMQGREQTVAQAESGGAATLATYMEFIVHNTTNNKAEKYSKQDVGLFSVLNSTWGFNTSTTLPVLKLKDGKPHSGVCLFGGSRPAASGGGLTRDTMGIGGGCGDVAFGAQPTGGAVGFGSQPVGGAVGFGARPDGGTTGFSGVMRGREGADADWDYDTSDSVFGLKASGVNHAKIGYLDAGRAFVPAPTKPSDSQTINDYSSPPVVFGVAYM